MLPHQCRCIVFDDESQNRCQVLVWEGPDAPLCQACEADHWGPDGELLKQRGLGHRLAPHGGPMEGEYSITPKDG